MSVAPRFNITGHMRSAPKFEKRNQRSTGLANTEPRKSTQPLCYGCEPEDPPPVTSCPTGYILVNGACKKKTGCPYGYTRESNYDGTYVCVKAEGC